MSKKVVELTEIDKIEENKQCWFSSYDRVNGNPIKPAKLCLLYKILGYKKPICSECIIKSVTIETEE